jgi:UDP-glucuronate 4-epimerase
MILITGAAGFIGYHLCQRLLKEGCEVVGLDNLNNYYDVTLKEARLARLQTQNRFHFHKVDLVDRETISSLIGDYRPKRVVNLAAQAGVRYSMSNPHAYVESNICGFLNVLEACRRYHTPHLVYASSSSVYGANTKMPFSVNQNVDHPLSLYAATKKANELMAHTYSHLYGLPTTGLRFFTVYGPWGRPDMAMYLFAKAILAEEPIQVFNHGHMRRDFTYVDDIVEGLVRVMNRIPAGNQQWNGDFPDPGSSQAPFKVYNLGNSHPVELLHLISCLEQALGKPAIKRFLPMQPGDVPATFADVEGLSKDFDFQPSTSIEEGVRRFVEWYKQWHEHALLSLV